MRPEHAKQRDEETRVDLRVVVGCDLPQDIVRDELLEAILIIAVGAGDSGLIEIAVELGRFPFPWLDVAVEKTEVATLVVAVGGKRTPV